MQHAKIHLERFHLWKSFWEFLRWSF